MTLHPSLVNVVYLIACSQWSPVLAKRFRIKELENALKEYNISGTIEALTEREGRYLLRFGSLDTIRNRFSEARQKGNGRVLHSILQGTPTGLNHPVPPAQGVSLQQIREHYKGQQALFLPDGSLSIRFKNGKGVRIKTVEHIGGDDVRYAMETGRMGEDGVILGKYQDGEITLNKSLSNTETLIHENLHLLKDLGILTPMDLAAIDSHHNSLIKQNKYRYEVLEDREENQANTLAQMIADRDAYRNRSGFHRIIQKVMDFFDGLVHIGHMSARKLAREYESGRIYGREETATDGQEKPLYATIEQFSKTLGVSKEQLKREYDVIVDRYKGTKQWMKAPNGKPTNLNERQWALVRTPRFKAWFGNFEVNPDKEITAVEIADRLFDGDRKAAQEWLLDPDNGIVGSHHNDETRMDIVVSKRVLKRKSTSGDAVKKSRTPLHYEVMRKLPELLGKASLVAAESDKNNRDTILGVYKFVAPVTVENTAYAIKLTVKDHDMPMDKGASRFYTHELVDIEMPEHHVASGQNDFTTSSPGNPVFTVGQLIDSVNKKSPGAIPEASKVVDENGEPLAVYHGTESVFF